jgi:glutamate synthase (NADPH/NADH) large chain
MLRHDGLPSPVASASDGATPGPGLYRESFERDSCGFGLIAHMDDKPSHWLVSTAIGALRRMTHRGAIAADGKTGDGCGLLMKKPDVFLRARAAEIGIPIGPNYSAGNIFLSQDASRRERQKAVLAEACAFNGLCLAGWRPVPTDPAACGPEALKGLPRIEQAFVTAPDAMHTFEFELRLFKARRRAEKLLDADGDFYVTHLSCRVIVYKALVMPEHLPHFYTELQDPALESSICVFHQRFSTNTAPTWRLARRQWRPARMALAAAD